MKRTTGGTGGRKSLRFAVVKVLMMGRLGWKDESGEVRGKLKSGWREGLGVGEEEGMEVDGSENTARGEGWEWVRRVGEGIVDELGEE